MLKVHKKDLQEADFCIFCGEIVEDSGFFTEYPWVLEGPFCNMDCITKMAQKDRGMNTTKGKD